MTCHRENAWLQVVWAAQDKLDVAAEELKEARAGENIVQALLVGNPPGPDETLPAARTKHAEAEDDLSAARSAVSRLEATVLDRERALERAKERIVAAACEVLKAEAPDLSAELKTAEQRFVELRASMTWLLRHGAIANDSNAAAVVDHAATQGWSATETQLRRNIFYPEDQKTAAWTAWTRCLSGLTTDADAPLPG